MNPRRRFLALLGGLGIGAAVPVTTRATVPEIPQWDFCGVDWCDGMRGKLVNLLPDSFTGTPHFWFHKVPVEPVQYKMYGVSGLFPEKLTYTYFGDSARDHLLSAPNPDDRYNLTQTGAFFTHKASWVEPGVVWVTSRMLKEDEDTDEFIRKTALAKGVNVQ